MIAWTDLSEGLRAALVQTFHDKVDGVGPAACARANSLPLPLRYDEDLVSVWPHLVAVQRMRSNGLSLSKWDEGLLKRS